MIISRGMAALRAVRSLQGAGVKTVQPIRNSHDWNYRSAPKETPKGVLLAAEGIAAFAWWWVMWHLWTEPGHVFGEFPYPDPRKWSNEDLGIPN